MTSKLFHTVVAVGISLGAVACAQEPTEEAVTDNSAITSDEAKTSDSVIKDAFCDAAWPTTKGSHLRPPPACIDPQSECEGRPNVRCVEATSDRVCTGWDDFYPVCNAGTWECKPGKIPQTDCRCWQWPGGTDCNDVAPNAGKRPPQLASGY